MAAPDTSVSRTADTASDVDNGDDVVAFVVGDGQHKLYFSKRALMRHAPFFRAYFTEHAAEVAAASGGGSGATTVVLRHVKPRSAEAALRLCHSAHHSDDGLFWLLQRECEKADEAHKPEALQAVLSLYAACVKFELYEHAKAASATAAGAVTAHTVYDVLKTCARYATTLLPETRRAVGLDVLLAACYAFMRTSGAWQGERRWRRLYEQYPELSEIVAAASAATATSSAHGESSASAAAGGSPSPLRRVLLSPQKDPATAGSSATVMPESAAPLPDVFAGHLRQTEGLALAAQWRCRTMSAEVTALRESCAALEVTAHRDEAAAAEVALYLGEVRVYVQALGCAEAEMQQLCAAAATMCAAPSSSAAAASTLHELRHALQRASAWAAERKAAVDELLAMEQDAVCELDAELARLRAVIC
ncbi:BTB/POZ domain containing protein, putative [Leishmania donovani]|uniref:BTB/POZ domain containing protein, putative n=1 Tax=Leishmania donovani TaxID=5661 RepID=A0A3S7WV66_LEIDO|nr:BTB/POZ domain containing protein, putative [Leishmania donovani]